MDRLLDCPYNRSHQIRPERMQYHLIKCRKQYPEKNLIICPFNATHHVAKSEERKHMMSCPDRRIVDIQRYRFNEPTPGHHGDLSNPKFYGSSKIPKEDPLPGSTAAAEAAKMKKKTVSGTTLMGGRPRSQSRDGATGTSIMDTTSVSSIGKDYLKKAGRVDILKDYIAERQRQMHMQQGLVPQSKPSVGGGLEDMSSLGNSLETRSGRRRRSASGERRPLRRPRASEDGTSAGSGVIPRSVTPITAAAYISNKG